MTENQKRKIDILIDTLPEDEQRIYREIAEYAVKLGYTPSQVKNVSGLTGAVAFTKSKTGKRLCKISPPSQNPAKGKALYQMQKTILALSFYATPVYSELFRYGIE